MECEARGFPVPRITWYRNGTTVVANISLVEITEARKSEHEGMYRCEAENPAGNVTASAWVAVKGLYNANYYNFEVFSCSATNIRFAV